MGVQTDSDAAAVWAHGKPVLRLRMAMPPASRQVLDQQLLSVLCTELRQQIKHATEVRNKVLICPFLLFHQKAYLQAVCNCWSHMLAHPRTRGKQLHLRALMTVDSNCRGLQCASAYVTTGGGVGGGIC